LGMVIRPLLVSFALVITEPRDGQNRGADSIVRSKEI
jgi:hypothetical protein